MGDLGARETRTSEPTSSTISNDGSCETKEPSSSVLYASFFLANLLEFRRYFLFTSLLQACVYWVFTMILFLGFIGR